MEMSSGRSEIVAKKREIIHNVTITPILTSNSKPLATVARMPQESASQNTANEDAATLPLPVPNFSIPAHLMGRNVENPTEDVDSHGRKLQKPRLGVKVPCRNLTSQIVTQEELAQELLERSLKKYPVHDAPEGGDIFFTIKLTQRLANRIAPSASSASGAITMQPVSGNTTDAYQKKHSLFSENNFSVQEPKVIADDKELLAILEGDVDPNWIPEKTSPSQPQCCNPETNKMSVKNTYFTTPPKLDPVLEKELALKQLMEFETSPRKKKIDNSQDKSPRKVKSKVKNPDTEHNALGENNGQKQGKKHNSEKKKETPVGNTVEVKNKLNHKRRAPIDSSDVMSKKRKSSIKIVSENIENGKTDKMKVCKLQKDSKKSPVMTEKEVSKNVINVIESVVNSSAVCNKLSDLEPKKQNFVRDETVKAGSFSGTVTTNMLAANHVNKSQNVSESETVIGKENLNINSGCLMDNNLNSSSNGVKRLSSLKTYSPKKKSDKTNETVEKVAQKTVSISNFNSVEQKQTDVSNIKKRVRRSELDKLLLDEGAINLLYEAELSESNRRSVSADTDLPLTNSQKRSLKPKLNSTRRKKKDLLLKTRLVKNAVLRLKTMQNPSFNLRAKRQIVPAAEKSLSASEAKMAPPRNTVTFESTEQPHSPLVTMPANSSHIGQSFSCPPKVHLRAEASRIIRRHSSSSNFSSRSTSPIVQRPSSDGSLVASKVEISVQSHSDKKNPTNTSFEKPTIKRSTEARKKGVPIFVRKVESVQTYKGKKRRDGDLAHSNSGNIDSKTFTPGSTLNKFSKMLDTKASNIRPANSKSKIILLADDDDKKKSSLTNSQKKITADKNKQKLDMVKNLQKNSMKDKHSGKVAKSVVENGVVTLKKKQLESRDKLQRDEASTATRIGEKSNAEVQMSCAESELTTCLAEAASAFAAEDRALRESSPSRVEPSSDATQATVQKKDLNRLHPQSPNAASYSNLVKTLEVDNQKQRRKEGEEYTKPRTSFRQSAGTFSYKEISLRRYDNLVQIIMNPASTKMKNGLNMQVLRELRDALHQMRRDESCRAVLLTSTGNVFCQGIDLHCLLHANTDRRKAAALEFSLAVKDFVKALAQFSKPLIAGVNGAAVGLGVTMLPFFDMIIASDKATFYTPYSKLGQVPEGGATLTLQHMFGNALTSELLFGSRRITANEALNFGLVTRILWPDRFQEELIPIVRSVSSQSSQSMEATKALLRHSLRTKLDAALESETHLLVQHWNSNECQTNVRRFLESEEEICLQRQRLDPDL